MGFYGNEEMKVRYTLRAESQEAGAVIRCCQNPGERDAKLGRWKWIAGCDSLRGEKRDQKERREEGGSGDESCGTIFHSRQKHLLEYQFGAGRQSSPPAPSSIIFSN